MTILNRPLLCPEIEIQASPCEQIQAENFQVGAPRPPPVSYMRQFFPYIFKLIENFRFANCKWAKIFQTRVYAAP